MYTVSVLFRESGYRVWTVKEKPQVKEYDGWMLFTDVHGKDVALALSCVTAIEVWENTQVARL